MRKNRDGCWMNNEYVGIIVYADDIALLSPTLDGLQNMIDTCSKYAKKHNLRFSTNENPSKSKTKCIAFQQKKKDLPSLRLNSKDLPWVSTVRHLGTTITNLDDCRMTQDMAEKRAAYIARNNELNQEYHYTYPETKIWLNGVFNTSFYGAPLWDLFSKPFERLEKTWNVSIRIMLSLPRKTHRYLIEPLSRKPHIVKSLWRRYLRFVDKINKGEKKVLRRVMDLIKNDTRSVTGRNLRHLRLMSANFDETELDVYSKPYKEIPVEDKWRPTFIEELMDAKRTGQHDSSTIEDLEEICNYVCQS